MRVFVCACVRVCLYVCGYHTWPHTSNHGLFAADAVTSAHPLLIGAGFDGTGLETLSRVVKALGKSRVAFPGIDLTTSVHGKALPSTPFLRGSDGCDVSVNHASRVSPVGASLQ